MSNQLNELTEVVLEKIARACGKNTPPLGTKSLPNPSRPKGGLLGAILLGEPKLPKKFQK